VTDAVDDDAGAELSGAAGWGAEPGVAGAVRAIVELGDRG